LIPYPNRTCCNSATIVSLLTGTVFIRQRVARRLLRNVFATATVTGELDTLTFETSTRLNPDDGAKIGAKSRKSAGDAARHANKKDLT
jgi:hypothetical protein